MDEKKVNATKLSDEELDLVSGGDDVGSISAQIQCPYCYNWFWIIDDDDLDKYKLHVDNCKG